MSLIGPRPERRAFIGMLEKETPYYKLRKEVRPGLTGWTQVNYSYAGEDIEDHMKKLEYDLYYIKNRFYISHYDITSMFAGKLNALLCRNYIKGRDWYDLLWYLTNFESLKPNFVMLNNAINQFYSKKLNISSSNWKEILKNKLKDRINFLE